MVRSDPCRRSSFSQQTPNNPLPHTPSTALHLQDLSVDITALGYTGAVVARDVWNKKDWPVGPGGTIITAKAVAAHDSVLLMLTPTVGADKTGAHPFAKISPEWKATINATE